MTDYVHVYTANGNLDAEMIRMFLESKGVQAIAYGESVGAVYGITIGPLGEVKIYVPSGQAEEAQQLLADMEQGKYDGSLPQELPADEVDQSDGSENHPE